MLSDSFCALPCDTLDTGSLTLLHQVQQDRVPRNPRDCAVYLNSTSHPELEVRGDYISNVKRLLSDPLLTQDLRPHHEEQDHLGIIHVYNHTPVGIGAIVCGNSREGQRCGVNSHSAC